MGRTQRGNVFGLITSALGTAYTDYVAVARAVVRVPLGYARNQSAQRTHF